MQTQVRTLSQVVILAGVAALAFVLGRQGTLSPSPTPLPATSTPVPPSPTLTPTATLVPPSPTQAPSPTPTPGMTPATPTATLPAATSTPTATPGPLVAIVGDVLRVRGGPGTGYDILGRLQPDTLVTLLARSADSGWFQIAYPAGTDQTGWVSAEFLQLQGAPDQVPVAQAPPTPTPQPTSQPVPVGAPNPTLLNGSFDDYQPYLRDGESLYWQDPEFPERYGADWSLVVISELERRVHLMDSEIFGSFTQKYFGGGGRDYHIHGEHSQVIASRSAFDLVLMQTVAAQPGQEYTFSGSIVSFYQGTSGPPVHDKVFKTLGIDPAGGRDYASPTVIWGERDGRDNEWRYPTLRVGASSDAITLFIRLENTEPDVGVTELNVIHLDDFKLGTGE